MAFTGWSDNAGLSCAAAEPCLERRGLARKQGARDSATGPGCHADGVEAAVLRGGGGVEDVLPVPSAANIDDPKPSHRILPVKITCDHKARIRARPVILNDAGIPMNYASKIAAVYKKLGLTQVQVAAALGKFTT